MVVFRKLRGLDLTAVDPAIVFDPPAGYRRRDGE
jgi:hypothetical protein